MPGWARRKGVGVSGCEPREARDAGGFLRAARVEQRELSKARSRLQRRRGRPGGARGRRGVRARWWRDGDPRPPSAGPAVLPPRGSASRESRGGGAARGHHFLRAGDTPPGRHGGAEAAVAARGSSCTCITGGEAAALLLCGFFPC
jgi:hypothetical protein